MHERTFMREEQIETLRQLHRMLKSEDRPMITSEHLDALESALWCLTDPGGGAPRY